MLVPYVPSSGWGVPCWLVRARRSPAPHATLEREALTATRCAAQEVFRA